MGLYNSKLWVLASTGGAPAPSYDFTTDLEAGFIGTDTANWTESSGDLVSIQNLVDANTFIPTVSGEILWTSGQDYIVSDGSNDSNLDMNNGDNSRFSPGAGVLTYMFVIEYRQNNSDRHIKWQNNGGSNTLKVNPTGLEIRNNGQTTETISTTFTSGSTYFVAVQRKSTGKYQVWVGSGAATLTDLGESTMTSTTDLGGLNEITLGDTERYYMFMAYNTEKSASDIQDAYDQVNTDFTLGP